MKRDRDRSWQEACAALLEQGGPCLVALDLDFTLWPCYCFEHTRGPYHKVDGQTVQCLDRNTGARRMLNLYPEASPALEFLKAAGVRLSLVSKSPDPVAAKGILSALGMWSTFLYPQIYSGRKTNHFRLLRDSTAIPYDRMLFFDDDERNLQAVGSLGVVTCHVDKSEGFSGQTLLRGLTAYNNLQRSQGLLTQWLSTPKSVNKKVFVFDQIDAKRQRGQDAESDPVDDDCSSEPLELGKSDEPVEDVVVLCVLPKHIVEQQTMETL